jgi:hypothetical protein
MNQKEYIEAMLAEAIRLAKAGDHVAATGLLRVVLENDPENVNALLWLAYVREDVVEMELTLQKVLQLDPTNEKALEWQKLIQQRRMTQNAAKLAPNQSLTRTGTGPLIVPPTPPNIIRNRPPATPLAPAASIHDATPTLNFNDWQRNMAVPNPPTASYLAESRPAVTLPDYSIREIQMQQVQPNASPVQIVIQVPDNHTRPAQQSGVSGWLVALMIGIVVLLIAGIAYVVISQNGGLSSIGKPDKSLYKGFATIDDLFKTNLEPHQRVDLVIPFDGGYMPDVTGYVKITQQSKAGTLIINWNIKQTPLNSFHSGQSVRLYGTVEGLGNTIVLEVEQATLDRG